MRSDLIKKGFERAPHRGLLRACGVKKEDFGKPFIAVCNSYTDTIPGHVHLQEFGKIAKKAIKEAGAVPFEFNTIGICDGIAMGHIGMRYSLASRELIADCVESMITAHQLDGMICITNCDKIIPGMLMATMRLNIPTIFVSGGPMEAGKGKDGKSIDLVSIFEGVGARKKNAISDEDLEYLEEHGCPSVGSCAGMFTANSMNCLCEALGIALPGNGTILATDERRKDLVIHAAKRVVELTNENIKPLDLINEESIDNAFILDMAMGGSTNTVLHTLAIANEAGLDYPLSRLSALTEKVPYICKVSPSRSEIHIEDVDRAGGISAILNEIKKLNILHLNTKTVTGKTIGENIEGAKILDTDIIRSVEDPFQKTGGLTILHGNLAPNGGVVKKGGVAEKMMVFSGPAKIFNSEAETLKAITDQKINEGDVIVIRYEGPKGGPGMPEMLAPTSEIVGMGLSESVALITDGRFSGGTKGACIGHISPEAAEGGPIAALKDGDIINIDIPNKKLEVELSDEEIEKRLAELPTFEPKIKTGWLSRYARVVNSANTGAVVK